MPENKQGQIQKEIAGSFQLWKTFAIEIFLFSLTVALGIINALKLEEILKIQKISLPRISFLEFFLYFSIATLLLLFILYSPKINKKKKIILRIIFLAAVFSSGFTSLSLWVGDVTSLIVMVILIVFWLRKPTVFIHNLLVILGIAGIGSLLGVRFEPLTLALLLICFSIYDFIAVYKTKHMVKMAQEMVETGTILALIIPPDILGFRENLNEVKPGGRFFILGGGDIAFPLLLVTSLISQGILDSVVVAIFALFGLLVSFSLFLSQKQRQPIPALPPIALFSIIGFIITFYL